jgi:hypothetical protein
MAKRFMTLFIIASLLVGTLGSAQAGTWREDFERRGTIDYPLRPINYLIFPIGWALNTVIWRPATYVACLLPDVTGCMPEDLRALGLDESYPQVEEQLYQEVQPSK